MIWGSLIYFFYSQIWIPKRPYDVVFGVKQRAPVVQTKGTYPKVAPLACLKSEHARQMVILVYS